jgi:hypothetical protein
MANAKRLLIVSPNRVDGHALRDEVKRRVGDASAEVRLIVPAVEESRLKHALGDVDAARTEAESELESRVQGLAGEGVEVSAAVGDSDPLVAVEDALGTFQADEVLIVTHPDDQAEWFEEDLFDRAAQRVEPPLIHVELTGEGSKLTETEKSGPGTSDDEIAEGEVEISPNLPPFSKRDLVGIFIAIIGTIVLALLAASGGNGDSGTSAARILIAIGFSLLNLAHVVGLLFFNSQQYRGPGRSLFANLSTFGTPIAIVVSLLL